jgi:hypothetical protein
MTSETWVNTGWTCGWSYILEELGRIASLEYPALTPSQEREADLAARKSPASTASIPPESEASTMPGPRISLPRPAALRPNNLPRCTPTPLRPFSNSGPPLGAWTGRTPDEHVVNRTEEKDVQSKPSHQGMREKDQGDSHARGISEKGGEDNKKAEQEKPAAPRPVIGMNDERGGKGH